MHCTNRGLFCSRLCAGEGQSWESMLVENSTLPPPGRLLINIPFRVRFCTPFPSTHTSDISPIIPCPRLLVQSRLPLILRLFSMPLWRSTPSKMREISAIIHSPPRSIAAIAPMLSLTCSRNKPKHLTNSGKAIPNCSSGSNLLLGYCMQSLPTNTLPTSLVMYVPQLCNCFFLTLYPQGVPARKSSLLCYRDPSIRAYFSSPPPHSSFTFRTTRPPRT